jgi:hypothetical protein
MDNAVTLEMNDEGSAARLWLAGAGWMSFVLVLGLFLTAWTVGATLDLFRLRQDAHSAQL